MVMRLYGRILAIMRATPSKAWRPREMASLLDAHPREVRTYFMKSNKIERIAEGRYRLAAEAAK
jgi:hypothetical protein